MRPTLYAAPARFSIAAVWRIVVGDDPTSGKPSGPDQFKVLCPFHEDRHPSCDVSLAKDAFICRSCEAAGGPLEVVICAGHARTRGEAYAWLRSRGL